MSLFDRTFSSLSLEREAILLKSSSADFIVQLQDVLPAVEVYGEVWIICQLSSISLYALLGDPQYTSPHIFLSQSFSFFLFLSPSVFLPGSHLRKYTEAQTQMVELSFKLKLSKSKLNVFKEDHTVNVKAGMFFSVEAYVSHENIGQYRAAEGFYVPF